MLPMAILFMQLRQQALEEERLRKEQEDEEAKAQVFITFRDYFPVSWQIYPFNNCLKIRVLQVL